MSMEITLNKKKYWINDGEFEVYKHPEYTTPIIYPQLSIYERQIGLIKDLVECFGNHKSHIFINIGLSHGGFVPINLASSFDKSYVLIENTEDDSETTHINNFEKNREIHNPPNIFVEETFGSLDDQLYGLKIINIDSTDLLDLDYVDYDTVILSHNNSLDLDETHKCFMLTKSSSRLYIPNGLVDTFIDGFWYYLDGIDGKELKYDNLINLCIMVKDAGDGFRYVLEQNYPFIDRWTILDTGSTDNTVEIIKDVLKNKKGELYQEPFINFRDSRNRCLDLAGQHCKYNIMLDDTYILRGNVRKFLEMIRGDQLGDSYNVFIKGDEMMYGSNRITKSSNNLRYTYTIHEIIQSDNNVVVQLPVTELYIEDVISEYMTERTAIRKQNDLDLLYNEFENNPDIPRTLYYIAETYVCLKNWEKAFEYFEKRINHPDEGYAEEVTESYLMCAEISCNYLGKPIDDCERMYLDCFNYDDKKPDSLICLGIYYAKNNMNVKAYKYLKQAFHLGFPTHVTSNLRPGLYNRKLPETLASLCLQLKDYELGLQATERYLNTMDNRRHHTEYNTIVSYYKIFNLLNKNTDLPSKTIINDKKIFCIVTDGGYKLWSGGSIYKEGVGGSETFIIEMARNIIKIKDDEYEVYVFCQTDEDGIYDGVNYIHVNNYVDFLNTHTVDTCIVSRFSEYVPVTLENGVRNVYLHLEDLGPSCNVIPMDYQLKKIFCMTPWHKEFFSNNYPALKDKADVFPNGINIDKFPIDNLKKKKHSFIYSSFPDRGLVNLLKMFPKIRERIPDATLNLFCNTKHHVMQQVSKELMDEIDRMIDEQKDCVINHGWVPKHVLNNYWLKSEVWLYPCTFMETFCITALEAAASCTLAITSDLAALNDVVSDRGILVKGDPTTEEWQNEAVDKLVDILDNRDEHMRLVSRNRCWARNYDWLILAEKMVEECFGNQNDQNNINYAGILNWTNDLPKDSKKIFEDMLDKFKDKHCRILEIGTYCGTSIIAMLNHLPDAKATVIDIWSDYDEESSHSKSMVEDGIEKIFYENMKIANMEDRVIAIKGDSGNVLMQLIRNGANYDFIYVDGSHKCLDCYTDLVLSWELLATGGTLAVDDYLWKVNDTKTKNLDIPYYAVKHFMEKFKERYTVLSLGYRVFLQKI